MGLRATVYLLITAASEIEIGRDIQRIELCVCLHTMKEGVEALKQHMVSVKMDVCICCNIYKDVQVRAHSPWHKSLPHETQMSTCIPKASLMRHKWVRAYQKPPSWDTKASLMSTCTQPMAQKPPSWDGLACMQCCIHKLSLSPLNQIILIQATQSESTHGYGVLCQVTTSIPGLGWDFLAQTCSKAPTKSNNLHIPPDNTNKVLTKHLLITQCLLITIKKNAHNASSRSFRIMAAWSAQQNVNEHWHTK
jgi:hypothetical protein